MARTNGRQVLVTLWVAAGLAAAGSAITVLAPLQRSMWASTGSDGRVTTGTTSQSLLEAQGAWVVVPALFPLLLVVVPLVLFRTRAFGVAVVACATVAVVFVFLTGFSIGLLYAPATVALVAAATLTHSKPRRVDWPAP